MSVNFRKRVLISETTTKYCEDCQTAFDESSKFCTKCGKSLKTQKMKIYANVTKNGITSYTYVLPNGVTMNSRGKVSLSLGNGISFSTK